MPQPVPIRPGMVFIACSLNLAGARFVRVTAYEPGDTHVRVEDAEGGYTWTAPIPVRQFHASTKTSSGRLRAIGYAYQPDGVIPWNERITLPTRTGIHAARRLPIGLPLHPACGATTSWGLTQQPAHTTVTCPSCQNRVNA
ncbi:hypothetical protein ABZ621_23435 [Streptomyces sp. NPDC007863]|uniref:hypothetical protein n=1 Tax=Streptomyces sp. NPDC007863 TaxID=3154894 RepID=UPI0034036A86